MCSALICGTALGEVFEGRGGHDHESNILKPEGSSGDSLGGHVGHVHAQNRGEEPDHDHGVEENQTVLDPEEEEHHGHKHHQHAGGRPEEFSLSKGSDDHDHDQEEASHDHEHDNDHDQKEASNDHDHGDSDDHNHDHDLQHADHHSLSPEMQQASQQRLQNPSKKHDHKHDESKHDHEYEENKEKVEIMSEFVALEKGLGGIHRCRVCKMYTILSNTHIFTKNTVLDQLNMYQC